MNEFSLIERYFAPLAQNFPGALGLKDDAALVSIPPGCQMVITKDAITAGVHFFADDPPDLIARKLIRVNLSDLAAMGARPYAVLLAAVFPHNLEENWLKRFAEGLTQDCQEFNVSLIGGDTTATSGPLTLSLTALGIVEQGREVRRSGAREGDLLCVSGTVGDAALGLQALLGKLPAVSSEIRQALVGRYHVPSPRLALGQALAGIAHGGMDLSDGLPGDVRHLCSASGVGCIIDIEALPLSPAAREVLEKNPDLLSVIVNGGDDYELLLAIPPAEIENAKKMAADVDVSLTVIGALTGARDIRFENGPGQKDITSLLHGYQHSIGSNS